MNLGFEFRGALERLPTILESMVARINTVWRKQHDATTGAHTNITAEDLTLSGDLIVRPGTYPGPGIWSSGSLPMPQPVVRVAPVDLATTPGIEYEIGLLSRDEIRIHSDDTLHLEGSFISIVGESPTTPDAPGDSILIGGIPGIVMLAGGTRPISMTAADVIMNLSDDLTVAADDNIILGAVGDVLIRANDGGGGGGDLTLEGEDITISGNSALIDIVGDIAIDADDDITIDAADNMTLVSGGANFNITGNTLMTIAASAVVVDGQDQLHLTFPASDVPSADPNTLDDYEEGTWTPVLAFGGGSTGITYTTQAGTYIKVGRKVTLNWDVNLSSQGSSTGAATLTGVPFAESSASGDIPVGAALKTNFNAALVGSVIPWMSGSTIHLYTQAATSDGPINETQFSNTARFFGTLTYFT